MHTGSPPISRVIANSQNFAKGVRHLLSATYPDKEDARAVYAGVQRVGSEARRLRGVAGPGRGAPTRCEEPVEQRAGELHVTGELEPGAVALG
jgi:hypothetical protein